MNTAQKKQKKVLIIDDDDSILDAMCLILEDVGYTVVATEKGSETLHKAKTFKPHIILLDVLMSGFDGREICKTLKSDFSTKHIPIVMVSAHPGVAKKISEFGADDFLAKPFEVADLLAIIERYIV